MYLLLLYKDKYIVIRSDKETKSALVCFFELFRMHDRGPNNVAKSRRTCAFVGLGGDATPAWAME